MSLVKYDLSRALLSCSEIVVNVFVINSIAKDVKITTIYGGVLPFILTDIIRMALLVAFPIISLWLPMTMAK